MKNLHLFILDSSFFRRIKQWLLQSIDEHGCFPSCAAENSRSVRTFMTRYILAMPNIVYTAYYIHS